MVKSSRGTFLIKFRGFVYGMLKAHKGDKLYWRCTSQREKCKARAIMHRDGKLYLKENHNHSPKRPKIDLWSQFPNTSCG